MSFNEGLYEIFNQLDFASVKLSLGILSLELLQEKVNASPPAESGTTNECLLPENEKKSQITMEEISKELSDILKVLKSAQKKVDYALTH